MKPRSSLFARIVSAFRRKKTVKPEVLKRQPREPKYRSIEALEGRIAPASLIDTRTVQFTDLDGDIVTVHFSKALFDLSATADNRLDQIFKFTDGTAAVPFASTGPQQLELLDITKFKFDVLGADLVSAAEGTSITIKAMKSTQGMGDDLTNVGNIESTGVPLGRVVVDGDLGQIDAGRDEVAIGVQALVVNSLFKSGLATQSTGTTTNAEKLESLIVGSIPELTVAGDFRGYVHTTDGTSISGGQIKVTAPGKIGVVKIGGSLIGVAAEAASSDNTGTIESARGIGAVTISGTEGIAGLVGGGGKNSGSLIAGKGIASVKIADSLAGGAGLNSGAIVSKGMVGAITVGGDILGNKGVGSGSIQGRLLTSIEVTGKLTGEVGNMSGSIISDLGIDAVTINGDVAGGTGEFTGGVSAVGVIKTVTLNGKLTGGGGFHSGFVDSQTSIGSIRVVGDVTGGTGDRSGTILSSGGITTAVLNGKLAGGVGPGSGAIFTGFDPDLDGTLGTLVIRGGMQGGDGLTSGSVLAGAITKATIGKAATSGNVQGGVGDFSGSIISQTKIDSLQIFGSVAGGAGDESATIQANGRIAAVNITGSLTGGGGDRSGAILAREVVNESGQGVAGSIGVVLISGDVSSGGGSGSGGVYADGNIASLSMRSLIGGSIQTGLGVKQAGNAAKLNFGEDIDDNAGTDATILVEGQIGLLAVGDDVDNAVIRAGRDILAATIAGDISNTQISAVGLLNPTPITGDLAIASIIVGGNVSTSSILAGYDITNVAVNADASIGKIVVKGNWTASSLAAGILDTAGNGFGNADDALISGGINNPSFVSQIASIIVKGTIEGTVGGTDQFGFTAQRILSFKNGSTSLDFNSAADSQSFALGTTGDMIAREV